MQPYLDTAERQEQWQCYDWPSAYMSAAAAARQKALMPMDRATLFFQLSTPCVSGDPSGLPFYMARVNKPFASDFSAILRWR